MQQQQQRQAVDKRGGINSPARCNIAERATLPATSFSDDGACSTFVFAVDSWSR